MGSDFIASILIKCHKIRAIERFLQDRVCSPNLFYEASDSQFSRRSPNQDGTTLEKPLSVIAPCNPTGGFSSTDVVGQEVQYKCAVF